MALNIKVGDLYDFKACPLRWKLTKMDKVVKEITTNDGIREALQSVLNFYYYHLHQGKELSFEELKAKFSSLWYKGEVFDIHASSNREKRKKELEAVGMLHSFCRLKRYEPDLVVASNLDYRIPFGQDFFIGGNIPLIREVSVGEEIVIFKSGKHKYDEFWQKTDMGVTLTAMAYESIFKKEADSIAVHLLRESKTIYVSRKRSDYKRLYKTISMIKSSIEKGWFYPRETYSCNRKCPAQSLCMEWS